MNWTTLFAWFGAIPSSFWGVIFGSGVTLAGVAYADRNNTRRLERKLAHDADEKRKQRVSDIRRGVYLELASEIITANAHLASLPDLPLSENPATGTRGLLAMVAQAQLVSETETALLVGELANLHTETLLTLAVRAHPMRVMKANIEGLQNRVDSGKEGEDQTELLTTQRDGLLKERQILGLKYAGEIIAVMGPISKKVTELVVAGRHELELGGDLSTFMQQTENRRRRMSRAIRKIVKLLRE